MDHVNDLFDLERFVTAQDPVFESVLSELRQGLKTGHWIWFVFPQLRGLGSSWMANHYGISARAEAEAYLQHPILGRRLIECVSLVNRIEDRSIQEIFGKIDALKFRSSMTLFAEAGLDQGVFIEALAKYFGGQADRQTLDRLAPR